MTPIDWALRPLKKFADFSGRAARAEYWWYALATGLIGLFLEFLDGPLGGPVVGVYGPVSLIFTFGLLLPGLAVTVRRLHDIGRSGWWALLNGGSYALILAGLLSDQMFGASWLESLSPSAFIAPALAFLVLTVVMLVFMVKRGTTGP